MNKYLLFLNIYILIIYPLILIYPLYYIIMKNYNVYQVLDHKNQYCIIDWSKKIFKSYDSLIAIYESEKNKLTLWIDRDYSKTTLKHLYSFLNDCNYRFSNLSKKIIEKAIKEKNLNWIKLVYNSNLR